MDRPSIPELLTGGKVSASYPQFIGQSGRLISTMVIFSFKTQMTIQLVAEKEQLHKQVHYYSERFEDFNDTLSKSNEAISGFRLAP